MNIQLEILSSTKLICGICCIVYALEKLLYKKPKHDLLSWDVLQLRHPIFIKIPIFDKLCSDNGIKIVTVFFLITSLISIITDLTFILIPCYFSIALSLLIFSARSAYGMDGSDQVIFIIATCLLLVYIHNTIIVRDIVFSFISLQLLFSYFISGYAKLTAKVWRNGEALVGIMGNDIYGNTYGYNLLSKNIRISRLLSWIVFCWEAFFFISIFCNQEVFISFIVIGVLFHLTNAIIMGLNTFFLAFISCYFPLIHSYLLLHGYAVFTLQVFDLQIFIK